MVEALVRSATSAPVSQNASRSGTRSIRSAIPSTAGSSAASLVRGVEGEVLQAVARVERREAHASVYRLDPRIAARIPIVERFAQQAARAQQCIVHGPRVDADGGDAGLPGLRVPQSRQGGAEQRLRVPVKTIG
ncbi:hypothetical protein GCM10025876_28110 [Demequina litorisediminis]|uniref:Uncharacterized protein n=1 Tax=Demequina litorisediminis TaxID=1849022 RepID=A0ABQ6IIP1_9MICO|nr:hypothetical protein GCM10025876_28110 [Demequina litorisediminis]